MAELTDTQAACLESAARSTGLAVSDLQMRAINAASELVVREHVTAALDEIEKRIGGWQEMAEWAAAHTEDPDQAQNSTIREHAYRRAVRIVRDYRQEQDR